MILLEVEKSLTQTPLTQQTEMYNDFGRNIVYSCVMHWNSENVAFLGGLFLA